MNVIRLLSVLLLYVTVVECFGISNVHFPYNNIIKGKSANVSLVIKGNYSIDANDILWPSVVRKNNFNLRDLNTTLYMCTGNTLKMLAQMDTKMHNKIMQNINTIKRRQKKQYEPLYNFKNPEYKCSKISLTYVEDTAQFKISTVVSKFGPIYFVDEVGVTAFHYTELLSHSKKDTGIALKYCEGNTYSGFLYKIAPRPICPDNIESRKRKSVKGKIIIYKLNIISYSHPVTKCTITNTYVYSNGGFSPFKSASDNKPPIAKPFHADLNKCKNSKEFKKYYPAASFLKDVLPVVTDGDHKLKCGPHHIVCNHWKLQHSVTIPGYFDSDKQNNGTFDEGLVKGTYSFGMTPNYQYMSARSQHDNYRKAIMVNTEMYIKNGVGQTPWGKIPAEVLKSNDNYYYGFNDGVVIWDPIPRIDVCEYIPRFTAEVDSIRYDHNDIDDIMDDSVYLKYFISDQFKSIIAVNNEMEFKEKKSLPSCIPKVFNTGAGEPSITRVYKLNNDEILIWYPYKKGVVGGNGHTKFHSALNNKMINIYKNNDIIRVQGSGEVSQIDKNYQLIYHAHYNQSSHASDDDTADIAMANESNHHQVQDIENIQYQNYKDKQQDERNQHIRVLQNCKQDQSTYDNFKKLLDIDPSKILSEKLNRPIEASHGGNNYFNIKECEKVIVHKVLKSMITNDTSYKINTDRFTDIIRDSVDLIREGYPVPDEYKDMPTILREKGNIVPSVGKCLSYPLVIFSLVEFPLKMIGQITKAGTIRTSNFVYLEQCDIRRSHAFDIEDNVYYFEKYRLKSVFKTNESNSNIKIVEFNRPADTSEEESVHYHIPTNVIAENLYSIRDTQAAYSTLTDLIYAVSANTLATVRYEYNPEYKGSEGDGNGVFDLKMDDGLVSSVTGGIGHIIGNVGSAGRDLIEGIGTGGGQLIEHAGSGVGKMAQGVGKGGASLISSLGSALGNTFLPVAIGVIGLIVLAAIIYVIYKKALLNDDDDDEKKLL